MHLSGFVVVLLFDVYNVIGCEWFVKKKVYFILSRRKIGARREPVLQDRASPKSKRLPQESS